MVGPSKSVSDAFNEGEKMRQVILGIAMVALTAAGVAAIGSAQEGTAAETTTVPEARIANGTRFGAWTVNCRAVAVNETSCVLSQRLVRTSDNVFLAEILAFWSGDVTRAFLGARVGIRILLCDAS